MNWITKMNTFDIWESKYIFIVILFDYLALLWHYYAHKSHWTENKRIFYVFVSEVVHDV